MIRGKSVLLTIPLVLSGIVVVASPSAAVTRIGTTADWASISAGDAHVCAIRVGRLYCWGNNTSGQVGNGGDSRQDAPDDIGSNRDWTSVSAGGAHTCGIRAGRLFCWGSDSSGQLGNGSTLSTEDTPDEVYGGYTNWKSVSAGASHTCAIRGAGYLYCWGNDDSGQVGNGSAASRPTPARVATTYYDWKSVSAGGSHSCAIRGVGYLYCWGNDGYQQLGNGDPGNPQPSPVRVQTAARDWKSASTGGTHTCAIRGVGYLYCWGKGSHGQVGYGGTGNPSIPTKVTYDNWKTVSAGATNTCAIRGGGALYCWGDNTYGQTSSSVTALFLTPKRFDTAIDHRRTDAGGRYSCAIRGSGIAYCWGGVVARAYPPAGTTKPGSILDLSPWKLQAPENTPISGDPDEIKYGGSPDLRTYANAAYFHANSSNTAVYFRAETDGETTSGSSYPRSELREMVPGSYPQDQASWSNAGSGIHAMDVTAAITHVPEEKPDVVAAQIHDGSGDVLQIRLQRQRLLVKVADYPASGENTLFTLTDSYELGTKFTVRIVATSSRIKVYYGSGSQAVVDVPKSGTTWYFKAGCYTQANTSNGTGYGEVLIHELDVDHS